MKKKALYVGSFDPITNGHLDIIKRASVHYENVVVGIAANNQKNSFFSFEDRKMMLQEVLKDSPNIKVDIFTGLLANYVNENKFDFVIRGLRATMDFEYEIQMAQMNARLYNHNVETIFLMTNPKYSFISSSLIKEVFSLGGDIQGLVPEIVLEHMKKKVTREE
ncbi:MAG: pantetheine-phosphate adenylyltransferase [Eubacteriales bacterium]|nr:pantetheine-phosphate adenylyltransferase [Eubacteriales bacterium]MDD4390151.1 pantetheine-phosphate adenylyltransferase [Eubacteriales bacterium]